MRPINTRIVFHANDHHYAELLKKHLRPLSRKKEIAYLENDSETNPDLILVLLSPDYFDDPKLEKEYVLPAAENRKKGKLLILPVFVRDCHYDHIKESYLNGQNIKEVLPEIAISNSNHWKTEDDAYGFIFKDKREESPYGVPMGIMKTLEKYYKHLNKNASKTEKEGASKKKSSYAEQYAQIQRELAEKKQKEKEVKEKYAEDNETKIWKNVPQEEEVGNSNCLADYVSYPLNGPVDGQGYVKLLIMTSNPKDTEMLDLDREIKAIQKKRYGGKRRNIFRVESAPSVEFTEVKETLEQVDAQLVHFSGHGVGEAGILFMDESGYSKVVSGEQLAAVFSRFVYGEGLSKREREKGVSCLFLNACYSEEQAKELSKYIPNVIGTDNAIADDKAITFSSSFYGSLFNGESFEEAYYRAKADTELQGMSGGAQVIFFKNGDRKD